MPGKVPSNAERFNVYEAITTTVIKAVEGGVGEFTLPWHRSGGGRPRNASTDMPYNGVNIVALWASAMTHGFQSPHWATYRQWAQLKAQVRRGQKASVVLFYKPLPSGGSPTDEGEQAGRRFVARASWVFNADQVEGWSAEVVDRPSVVERVEAAERLIALNGASVLHGGGQAFYAPAADRIHLPPQATFVGSATRTATEAYYAVLLHELVHWSGASHRLNREFGRRFGDEAYAFEELVAELGAAFLCADVGIANDPRPDHAAYIADWLTILSRDARAIVSASRLAGEAAAYLQAKT